MNRSGSMVGRLLAVGVVSVVVLGCAGPSPTGTPAAAATLPVTPAPVDATPTTAAATPTPVPLATFATTWDSATEAPAGATTVQMAMVSDQPRFQPSELTVPAGNVTLFLRNVPYLQVKHQFSLGPNTTAEQAASPEVAAGDAGVLTIENLPAGTYRFWCRLDGHHLLGMTGTLTVTP